MSFLVRQNWKDLSNTVWGRLEERGATPEDVFIELLRFTRRTVEVQIDEAADAALSDPELARQEFLELPTPQTEGKCIELLEGYYAILGDLSEGKIAKHYKDEIREFVEKHNLRYTVSDNCRFQLSVPGLLVSQFSKLRTGILQDPSLVQAMWQLESSLSRLGSAGHEERNCIGIATNLLEGIARQRTINGQITLGTAIDGCNVFPHASMRECIKNFYKFASDYPNIRHAGTPANKLRDLKEDDAILAIVLAIGFGSFVFDNNAGPPVLRGDL